MLLIQCSNCIIGYVDLHLTFKKYLRSSESHPNISFSLTQVSSVLCAPKQWGSHWEETRGPQEPDPGGGNRKSIQSEWYNFYCNNIACMLLVLQANILRYTGTVIFCISLHNEDDFCYECPGAGAGEVWGATGAVSVAEVQWEEWNNGKALWWTQG